MKRTMNRGFTLIELLVVIAIIGILASVVLASLNSARERGAVAAYQAEIQQSVADALVQCESDTDTITIGEGSQRTAVTGASCSDFIDGTDLQIDPLDASLPECGSISIDGATFTGAVCP